MFRRGKSITTKINNSMIFFSNYRKLYDAEVAVVTIRIVHVDRFQETTSACATRAILGTKSVVIVNVTISSNERQT